MSHGAKSGEYGGCFSVVIRMIKPSASLSNILCALLGVKRDEIVIARDGNLNQMSLT